MADPPSVASLSLSGTADRPLRLLSLDGGGIRGLSTLLVLDSIMHQLDAIEGPEVKRPLKLATYFDLIGGTSTGGLIAIMLGRLGMDTKQCIQTYLNLSPEIFPTESLLGGSTLGKFFKATKGKARFPSGPFETELRKLMVEHRLDEEERLEPGTDRPSSQTKVFVCCTLQKVNKEVRLRTYRSWETGTNCTIWQAARATSAAPLFFEPIEFGTPPIKYVDGGVHMNNPIRAVLDEAHSLWPRHKGREIGCVVSIGTGIQSLQGVGTRGHEIIKAMVDAATDCENVAREFREGLNVADPRPGYEYFRFNVDGIHGIGLEDWNKFDYLSGATANYLRTHRQEVERCAGVLSRPISTTVASKRIPPHKLRTENVPLATETFFGRSTELSTMHSHLIPSKNARNGFVLHGIPGSGKTQLALRYIAKYGDAFSHILWISAASMEEVEISFADAARRIAATGTDSPASATRNATTDREYVHDCLEKHLERNWLIVLDSLDSPTPGSINYLPRCNHGSVLITSIRADTKDRYQFPGCEVSRLDEDSACSLLSALSNLPSNKESNQEYAMKRNTLKQIARHLDCHALSLELSGVLLRKRWVDFENFVDALQSKYAKLMDDSPKMWEWSYDKDRSVWKAFYILFMELKNAHPTAATLFCLCAHYGSWALSKDFLLLVAATISSQDWQLLGSPRESAHLPRDEYDLRKAVNHLEDLSFVTTTLDERGDLKKVTIRGPLLRWCLESLDQKLDWCLLACACIGASTQKGFKTAFARSYDKVARKKELHWHDITLYDQNMRHHIPMQRCYERLRTLCTPDGADVQDIIYAGDTRRQQLCVAFVRRYGELKYSIGNCANHYQKSAELLEAVVDHDRMMQGSEWPDDLDSFLTWACQALAHLRLNEDTQRDEKTLNSVCEIGLQKFHSHAIFLSIIGDKLAGVKTRQKISQPHENKARLAGFTNRTTEDQSNNDPVTVRSLRSYEQQYDTARLTWPDIELRSHRQRTSGSDSGQSDNEPYQVITQYSSGVSSGEVLHPSHTEPCPQYSRSSPNTPGQASALAMMNESLSPSRIINLDENQVPLRTFALRGLGGVGKSKTARRYFYTQRRLFDYNFWVAADSHESLHRGFAEIAVGMRLVGSSETHDVMALCDITRSWLVNPQRRGGQSSSGASLIRWLLVFDDVTDFAELRKLWPFHGTGSILITTRDPVANVDESNPIPGYLLEPLPHRK